MDGKIWKADKLPDLVERVIDTYSDSRGINHIDGLNLPSKLAVYDSLDKLFRIFFPGYVGDSPVSRSSLNYLVGELLDEIYTGLSTQMEKAYRYRCKMDLCEKCDCRQLADDAVIDLLEKIPEIRDILKNDVSAAYDGDPAAKSFDEIILSYPCIEAIATHRIAHELHLNAAPLIPRMMSERAHSRTGIDIHPGANIGMNFFIDHGTGVVIGETTDIGDNVKIYQGVTLGAMSFPKDERGRIIKGRKRHPTLEDNVIIYAASTILGGETVIGKGATIGGNTWITSSVAPGTKVVMNDENDKSVIA
jgi:serine O-acetyltransferase